MINKLETTLNFIAKHNDADDYSITARIKDSLDTRFAQNRITQNISGVKFSIDVALYYGKKCGTVSIDQLDEAFILEVINEVLTENKEAIYDIKNGKDRAFGFLVGQVMKRTKGKANPALASKLMREEINKH